MSEADSPPARRRLGSGTRRTYARGMFGLLNVNKPPGPTSHDIVAAVRRLAGRGVKVGHAGTLDPFAGGVLVVCVGAATRLADYVQRQPKRYTAGIVLGATSDTDDSEGEIAINRAARAAWQEAVLETTARFVGEIQQVPPAHSAVHVDGRRAYKLARAGERPNLKPRTVRVGAIELLAYDFPHLRVDVRCGSGTYIRALARDIGAALGVGGYCGQLTRTEVGPFTIDAATPPDQLDLARDLADPLLAVQDMPKVTVSPSQADLIRTGRRIRHTGAPDGGEVAVVDGSGRLLAVATVTSDAALQPAKVFPTAGH